MQTLIQSKIVILKVASPGLCEDFVNFGTEIMPNYYQSYYWVLIVISWIDWSLKLSEFNPVLSNPKTIP